MEISGDSVYGMDFVPVQAVCYVPVPWRVDTDFTIHHGATVKDIVLVDHAVCHKNPLHLLQMNEQ